ncbi:unnamed protein product [Sphagnum jensenii]|uniref:Glycosyl hydrolase family 32 N-terminal domain-containing protein n=1 Tax=Sphagnum jensenii TaxID=128206 RepID=A0ABP1BBC9_9BRYO
MTGTESQEAAVVTEVQDHEEELQQPQKHLHRTSFHYQPVKNWMGGSAHCFIDPDGIPFVLYIGQAEEKLEQMQNMAVPADPLDPLLRKWVKVSQNPILKSHPGVAEHCFRDPSTAW